jgi:hypothetical protein
MTAGVTLTGDDRARWVRAEQAGDSWAAGLPFSYPDVGTTPPVECVDLLMWFVALQMLVDHRPVDGCPRGCADCFYVRQGLATACGVQVSMSDYWRGLTAIRRAVGAPLRTEASHGA